MKRKEEKKSVLQKQHPDFCVEKEFKRRGQKWNEAEDQLGCHNYSIISERYHGSSDNDGSSGARKI